MLKSCILFNRSSSCNPSPIPEWVHKAHFSLSSPRLQAVITVQTFSALSLASSAVFSSSIATYLLSLFPHYLHSLNKTACNINQNSLIIYPIILQTVWSLYSPRTPPAIPNPISPTLLHSRWQCNSANPVFPLENVHHFTFILNLFLLNLDHTILPKCSNLKFVFLSTRMSFNFIYILISLPSAASVLALHLQNLPISPIFTSPSQKAQSVSELQKS